MIDFDISHPIISGDTGKKSDNDGEVYFEIIVDSETKEYTIGTAVMPEPFVAKHQRQGSGTYKYSLLPPQEEKGWETSYIYLFYYYDFG